MKYILIFLLLISFVSSEYLNNSVLLNDPSHTEVVFDNFVNVDNDIEVCTHTDGCDIHLGNDTVLLNASKSYFFNLVPKNFDSDTILLDFSLYALSPLSQLLLLILFSGFVLVSIIVGYYFVIEVTTE